MLPASAVPCRVGWAAGDAVGVGGAGVRVIVAAIAGAAGVWVSMVTLSAVEAAETVPATSVAVAVMLWRCRWSGCWSPHPVAAAVGDGGAEDGAAVSIIEGDRAANLGGAMEGRDGSLVTRSVAELPVSGVIVAAIAGAAGMWVSMVTLSAAEAAETFPAGSVAFAMTL